jgi:hypothetical protein
MILHEKGVTFGVTSALQASNIAIPARGLTGMAYEAPVGRI